MNKVILIGRLCDQPELRYTAGNNKPVCKFSLAVNRRFIKGKPQQADFFRIIAWNGLGEYCSRNFKKGVRIAVIGRLENRSWEDNTNTKHYITEVIAENAEFADGVKDNGSLNNARTETTFNESHEESIPEEDELPF